MMMMTSQCTATGCVFPSLGVLLIVALGLLPTDGKQEPAITWEVPPPHKSCVYFASVVRIKDGDTLVLDVELGLGVSLCNQSVRLIGLDAPETFYPRSPGEREAGQKVTAFLTSRLTVGERVALMTPGRDSFGRILGTIWDDDGNVNNAVRDYIPSVWAGHRR